MASLGFDLARDEEFLMLMYRQAVKDRTIDPQETTWEDYYAECMADIERRSKQYGEGKN